jgi:Trypsin-like peptidase domain
MDPADTSRTPRRLWLAGVFALVVVGAGTGATQLYRLQARLDAVEHTPTAHPEDLQALRGELERIEARVDASRSELDALRSTGERTEAIDGRLAKVESGLVEASAGLRAHQAEIDCWEEFREQAGPRALDARMASFAREVEKHWQEVDVVAQTAIDIAEATDANLELVRKDLARDTDRMWRELVGPTVQLAGESTVGSGVLLQSELIEPPDIYRTYLITAWHVVRDIQDGEENRDKPVPMTIYGQDGRVWHETARLLKYNAGIDAALLAVNTTRAIECGARLATPERIDNAKIFEQIYAVGCPLGNDPIPTFGEIADVRHVVDGESYWMISAPTYIGNSGGGIYDAKNHELLGIFSKIYTHGALRPTVVPHMGLATPLSAIYGWLETVGYAHVVPGGEAEVEATMASAKR